MFLDCPKNRGYAIFAIRGGGHLITQRLLLLCPSTLAIVGWSVIVKALAGKGSIHSLAVHSGGSVHTKSAVHSGGSVDTKGSVHSCEAISTAGAIGATAARLQQRVEPRWGIGRSGPSLKPGTVCVCVMNGLKKAWTLPNTHLLRLPGQGPTFLPMFKPFRGPLVT